jgi:hypothetical protein
LTLTGRFHILSKEDSFNKRIEANGITKKKGGWSNEVVVDEDGLMLSGCSDVCDWHHAKSVCGVFPIRSHFHVHL